VFLLPQLIWCRLVCHYPSLIIKHFGNNSSNRERKQDESVQNARCGSGVWIRSMGIPLDGLWVRRYGILGRGEAASGTKRDCSMTQAAATGH
jgi:hypothetical protein